MALSLVPGDFYTLIQISMKVHAIFFSCLVRLISPHLFPAAPSFSCAPDIGRSLAQPTTQGHRSLPEFVNGSRWVLRGRPRRLPPSCTFSFSRSLFPSLDFDPSRPTCQNFAAVKTYIPLSCEVIDVVWGFGLCFQHSGGNLVSPLL